jgi:hypothetical protein
MRAHTVEFLDIAPFLADAHLPEAVLRRGDKDIWRARIEPVSFDDVPAKEPRWSLVRQGELVRIPLIPYRTASQTCEEVLVMAIDTALRCAYDHPNASRVHMVMGRPVENLLPEVDAFRFWFGFAVRI